jgi:hypothetical protein
MSLPLDPQMSFKYRLIWPRRASNGVFVVIFHEAFEQLEDDSLLSSGKNSLKFFYAQT